jgi:5-dehydro-2-deoxygluconokinase
LVVRDERPSRLIFYRTDCADMALDESEIDEAFIASAKRRRGHWHAFRDSERGGRAAQGDPLARKHGRKVVFDVDYRPNLWGLAGHAAGEERYIRSDSVTQHLQAILPDCDLIVGTEEELHAAGGSRAIRSLRSADIRALSKRPSCCKRGPMGCIVYDGRHSCDDRGRDQVGRAFRSRSIMSWAPAMPSCPASCAAGSAASRSPDLRTWANACGAFAVSRLLCSPE